MARARGLLCWWLKFWSRRWAAGVTPRPRPRCSCEGCTDRANGCPDHLQGQAIRRPRSGAERAAGAVVALSTSRPPAPGRCRARGALAGARKEWASGRPPRRPCRGSFSACFSRWAGCSRRASSSAAPGCGSGRGGSWGGALSSLPGEVWHILAVRTPHCSPHVGAPYSRWLKGTGEGAPYSTTSLYVLTALDLSLNEYLQISLSMILWKRCIKIMLAFAAEKEPLGCDVSDGLAPPDPDPPGPVPLVVVPNQEGICTKNSWLALLPSLSQRVNWL